MEDSIIGLIAEAENSAAEKKAQAQASAAEIVAAAEKRAQEIAKTSDTECAAYRESAIKNAETSAQAQYKKTLDDCRLSAEKYADGLLAQADNHILDIVGRLTK